MSKLRFLLALLAVSALFFTPSVGSTASLDTPAHTLEAVDAATLNPARFQDASLVVFSPADSAQYSPKSLESLGVYRLTTRTPWRETAANFEGVRLVDLLTAHGLADVTAIRVTAENDYSVVIPRHVWTDHVALVATRVDGRAHSRRARGPIQFVFDLDRDSAVGEKSFEQNWVWMAARIEPAD